MIATKPLEVTLIGFGAIGNALLGRLSGNSAIAVTHVVVRPERVRQTQDALQAWVTGQGKVPGSQGIPLAVDQVPDSATLVLECAGHGALTSHVVAALRRGCECAVLSVGALAQPGLAETLEEAARQGRTKVHLLSGAIGGIEALAAAKLAGLAQVTYTGRKNPSAWAPQAAPISNSHPKDPLVQSENTQSAIVFETVILESSAREAAQRYPKNANVAATVALAGLGLDATRVRLIADPAVTENIHEIHAVGAFGDMHLRICGKPLAENPKTSALTVLSALRFLHNRALPLTI